MALQCLKSRLVGQPKIRKLDGREYYVFRMVVMKEGVVQPASTDRATLFRGRDIRKYASAFNTKPIVLDHPQNARGRYISAASRNVLSRSKVGFVLKNRFHNGFLHAEAWIDKKKIISREPRFLDYIDRGMTVEVSGAMVSTALLKSGNFQGKRYNQIATEYRPDHVALLLDDIGACSVADGCGLLVAKKGIPPKRMRRLQEAINSAWNGKHKSCSCHKKKGLRMIANKKGKKASRRKQVDRLIAMKVGWSKKQRDWLRRLDGEDFGNLLVQAKKLKPVNTKIKAQQKPSRDEREDEDDDDARERPSKKKSSSKKRGKQSRKERLASKGKTSKKQKRLSLKSLFSDMTAAQVVKAMPGRLGEVFSNGLKAHGSNRKRLIDIICSADNSEFEKQELRDESIYPLSTLRKLAKLAIRDGGGEEGDEYAPFMGNTPGGLVANSSRRKESDEPHLIMPSMPLPDSDDEE